MNIYLIDDHALFRDGLISLLESRDISAKGSSSAKEGITEIESSNFDIILLDLRMPESSGLEVLQDIKAAGIKTPVVMLTTSTDEYDLKECLKRGAQGYLLKDMDPEELVDALIEAQKGSIVVAKDMTHILAKVLRNELTDSESTFDSLTNREKEVACLVASGFSNKVIARELGI